MSLVAHGPLVYDKSFHRRERNENIMHLFAAVSQTGFLRATTSEPHVIRKFHKIFKVHSQRHFLYRVPTLS